MIELPSPITFLLTHIDLHLPVEAVVQQQVVGHPDPVGLHRMPLAIIIVSNITWGQKGFCYSGEKTQIPPDTTRVKPRGRHHLWVYPRSPPHPDIPLPHKAELTLLSQQAPSCPPSSPTRFIFTIFFTKFNCCILPFGYGAQRPRAARIRGWHKRRQHLTSPGLLGNRSGLCT